MINTRDRERITRWLWQLLAYAWLDEDDRYTIRHVGLYLARHGQLLTWPLADYAATLTAGADLEQLRREFHDLAASAITADRGTRPPAGAVRATTARGKPTWDPNKWP